MVQIYSNQKGEYMQLFTLNSIHNWFSVIFIIFTLISSFKMRYSIYLQLSCTQTIKSEIKLWTLNEKKKKISTSTNLTPLKLLEQTSNQPTIIQKENWRITSQNQQECIANFNCIQRNGVMEFYMLEMQVLSNIPLKLVNLLFIVFCTA